MRPIRFIPAVITSTRILLVVAGMLSVVAMMGATAKQAPRTRQTQNLTPALHLPGLASTVTRSEPALPSSRDNELLHEGIESAVGHIDSPVRQVTMEVTAYCACSKCCGPNACGITASGRDTSYNNSLFVAADPSLPFGTKVLIPGYSETPVEVIDRGSAIRGDKIDVFFSSHEDAVQWGRRQLLVTIVE